MPILSRARSHKPIRTSAPAHACHNELLVVLPFYFKDAELAVELLNWCGELDGTLDYECLLAFDTETDGAMAESMAKIIFRKVHLYCYEPPAERVWPLSNNHMFRHVSRHIARHFADHPWLLLETDTVPLWPGWLDALQLEYQRGNKPFMGHVVDGMGHMNGQGIYPPHVAAYTKLAYNCPGGWAWDIAMRPETEAFTHDAKHLIGHIWNMDANGRPVMCGDGVCPTFADQATVDRFITPEMATFHRCKDASLIHRLRERKARHAVV